VNQVQLALLDDLLLHVSTLPSCSISPGPDGALIEIKCLHNGLNWTAIRQKRDHNDHKTDRLPKPKKHRSLTSTNALPTGFAPITRTLAFMDDAISFAHSSSCAALGIRTKYSRCIHWFLCCFHSHDLPTNALFVQLMGPLHQLRNISMSPINAWPWATRRSNCMPGEMLARTPNFARRYARMSDQTFP